MHRSSLTLKSSLQQVAAEELGDEVGAVVALDPQTGAILAMVTSPTYDPADLAGHDSSVVNQNYQSLLAQENGPLINRAIAGDTYPPGSTFKAHRRCGSPGGRIHAGDGACTRPTSSRCRTRPRPSATMAANRAATASPPRWPMRCAPACNTAFADLGMGLGWSVIERKAEEFGFTDKIDIPLSVTASRLPSDPDDAQTAMSAIGQYDVRSTPLQMAMVAAAIANDGTLMTPYLVDTVRAPDLKVIDVTEPEVYKEPMTTEDANTLTDMMVDVVDSGTGTAARISGVEVAGKTGTAETGVEGAAPHAWFVSFAPANDPVIAVAVVVENGGSLGSEATGGKVAAPIAKAVMEEAIRLDEEGDL
ncbi:penicillin-binding transpeptidase domain-containing protein [Demequina litorisediminis]|uniref:Penicillin-binding protein transpeptidase domain-containing protein n=1 Tax=Demequina litorisediminis TaxID=1849022 RepID=A0ABQ6IG35_9MICO|nr:hypothetical protein GCM10025876_18920 [Demequina litorisediminis]